MEKPQTTIRHMFYELSRKHQGGEVFEMLQIAENRISLEHYVKLCHSSAGRGLTGLMCIGRSEATHIGLDASRRKDDIK